MANFVPITAGSGTDIEAYALNDGAETVYRQASVIGDDTTFAAKAKVSNADAAATDYGLTVRKAIVGASNYHAVAAATTNAASIKGSAGIVFGWTIFNNAAYPVYVKFHNLATTPTAGTGVVHTIGVQAGTAAPPLAVESGIGFSTGIGISIVKGITDADATAVALSDCVVDIKYK